MHACTNTPSKHGTCSVCPHASHCLTLRNSLWVPWPVSSLSLFKLSGATHGFTSPFLLVSICEHWKKLECGLKIRENQAHIWQRVRLLKKTQAPSTKLVPKCFISKLKTKPCSLLELFEASKLQIPIKRKWLTVIDLMLAQLAGKGEGSSNTTQTALLFRLQWHSIWHLFSRYLLEPSSFLQPQPEGRHEQLWRDCPVPSIVPYTSCGLSCQICMNPRHK